ncbi:hypothetical protein [Colwellia sp. BRX10-4]|jgi:hypothetical protein|uniref:hypothetical protein n=1 Tax=Colwellia sp. BRX10-4 TaxID=2759843 RepID=UPI0015F44FA2|nr:hypothetical protein [Colwellia sp. BRX10-4]MBA6397145.1 hypothetical protein [Colwellia sp. BRX10-4]
MNISTSKLNSALELYLSAFQWQEPHNGKSLGYRIHKLIFQLMNSHFENISVYTDIQIIVKELDGFIRQLKAEFNCIHVDLDSLEYPNFVAKLEALKPHSILDEYHALTIELSKLMLFRIVNSDEQNSIEKRYRELIMSLVHEYSPTKKINPLFNDKKVSKSKTDIQALIKQQIDITIDH